MTNNNLQALREQEYLQRQVVNRLRWLMYEQPGPAASPDLLEQLWTAEQALIEIEGKRAMAQANDPKASGQIFSTSPQNTALLGANTTGLEAQVNLRMSQVPTAIYHLFNLENHPLVTCKVRYANKTSKDAPNIRRLRVTSYVEGYSAQAVDTVELALNKEFSFNQLPTLFPEKVHNINELTRAMLNVMVEDLDNKRIEIHKTQPIWLLARNSAPLAVLDPKTGDWKDMTPYFGAFVTPNVPAVRKFTHLVAQYHPQKQLVGNNDDKNVVESQVKAIFEALKNEAQINYVNSVLTFSPEEGSPYQRVRLPRETLEERQANCIDGTLLFASLMEAISLSPVIVVAPAHAFVSWEITKNSEERRYLETTLIGSQSFMEACQTAESLAQKFNSNLKCWPLRVLRTSQGIMPME